MTREDAITYLNVIWNRYKAEYEIERETLDAYHMAIEALQTEAEPIVIRSKTLMPTKDFEEWAKRVREVNPNAIVIPCDAEVVSAEAVKTVEAFRMAIEALSADAKGANLINRHDATTVIREECWKCNRLINADLLGRILALPTSQQTDCTDFIMWLIEVVLDDEDWELNAVAYGEIIARKLKKFGLLEVKDGYYLRTPSADVVQGEWIGYNADKEDWLRTDGTPIFLVCDKCHGTVINNGSAHWNFCPNCGARMTPYKGGDDE